MVGRLGGEGGGAESFAAGGERANCTTMASEVGGVAGGCCLESDAHLLVAFLHRKALLRMTHAFGKNVQGLTMGARALSLSTNWRRKARELDACLGIVEKISMESIARWLGDL